MKLLFLILMPIAMKAQLIIDFNQSETPENWVVVDDVVMGGESFGKFSINKEKQGVFEGKVSLENNGGFSSVRYQFPSVNTSSYSKVILKIKGDQKNYQFRIKSSTQDYFSYISIFETNGTYEKIEIPLNQMYPAFRGKKLDQENFSEGGIEQITFLIANKNAEDFKLLIESVTLE